MFKKLIFLFLDGFGLGMDTISNPFVQAQMPFITGLINCKFISSPNNTEKNELIFKGIDACLGVEGIPQSATGQTTLFTGVNASKYLGRHLTAFPNKPLIELIHKSSILKLAEENGIKSTFANAYGPNYFKLVKQGLRFHSVTTHCVFAANLTFRTLNDLLNGNAVYWDFTNLHIKESVDKTIPLITPYMAGKRLAALSNPYGLVLYECFMSDLIGHQQDMRKAIEFLENFDTFIQGIVENMDPEVSLLLTSDHGNIEDLSIKKHTYNHVPLLVKGPMAQQFKRAESISDLLNALFQ